MGKIKELLRDYWLVGFIVVLSLMATEIFGALTGWWSVTNFEERIDAGDLLRSLILCIVGMGGAYGLHLATKRQETFSHQGFNDRLGRGVESLANDDVVIRSAGIRVLIDLANSVSEAQKSIVANIIFDFFRKKITIKFDENIRQSLPVLENDNCQDVQNALDFFINLSLDEREKLLPNRLFNGRLDLRAMDFSHLIFEYEKLEQVDFSRCYFFETKFFISKIVNANFSGSLFKKAEFNTFESCVNNTRSGLMSANGKVIASEIVSADSKSSREILVDGTEIEKSEFVKTSIEDTHFTVVRFTDVNFYEANFIRSGFSYVRSTDVKFIDVNLTDTRLHWNEFVGGFYRIKDGSVFLASGFVPHFIGTCIRYTKFDLASESNEPKSDSRSWVTIYRNDQIKPDFFFKFCYYLKDEWSSDAYNPLDADRGYEIFNRKWSVFVPSDKPWSEQPVKEWVAVEIAEWRLEQAKLDLSYWMSEKDIARDIAIREKELREAKENLRLAQIELRHEQEDLKEQSSQSSNP